MMRIAPWAPICQSGLSLRNESREFGERQRRGTDHRADGRDPAAHELAAAEDDAAIESSV